MKVGTTLLLALIGFALGNDPSPECVGIKGTSSSGKGTCAEQCEAALKEAVRNKKTESKTTTDPKAVAETATDLHEAIIKGMEKTCELPVMTTKITKTAWYKSIWFITLVSVIALLAVLGAIYHFMGHPGMTFGDSNTLTTGANNQQPTDAFTNVDRDIPEDAERLVQ